MEQWNDDGSAVVHPVRHHMWTLPEANGRAQLCVTVEDGIWSDGGKYHVLALTREQVRFAIRRLVEIESRME